MKIAIIGTGITGNAAAWLLNQKHDITVFEQDNRIGGHSNTVSSPNHADVDTGFIVYNEWTYPNLIALFKHLNVDTMPTDMSFAASLNSGAYEYSGDALFGQKSNYFRPGHYKMLLDIVRFYKNAPELLERKINDISLGEYLAAEKYSQSFIDNHILPMAAAIWSTGADDVRNFPAASFVRFFVNHGLLLLKDRPQWHTVVGGSKRYVEKLTKDFRDKIQIGNAITAITRHENDVELTDAKGKTHKFDHVVIAAHADQTLKMLKDASEQETSILGAFPYAPNIAYLHTDETLMPKRKSIWSSWNYLTFSPETCHPERSEGSEITYKDSSASPQNDNNKKIFLTYWMNKLQPLLPEDKDLFVTLNPPRKPAADKTLKIIEYDHPQYTLEAINAWENIKTIQGINRTWFCGAWCGYGFHEDGLSAGLAVAESLGGIKRPWDVTDKSPAGENCRTGAS